MVATKQDITKVNVRNSKGSLTIINQIKNPS